VDSCVRTSPIRGSRTCRWSCPASPNDPVENRTLWTARLPLNTGNRIAGPCRVPSRLAFQFPSAAARFASPEAYASLEFSAHHGATRSFAWLNSLRSAHPDQLPDGVSCARFAVTRASFGDILWEQDIAWDMFMRNLGNSCSINRARIHELVPGS
jgi:hypothetical protein